MKMQDKIFLLTGARNACAQAIAIRFAREGAHCVAVDGELAAAEMLAAKIRALGRRALALQIDTTNKLQVEEMVQRAVAAFGRIDVLLNSSAHARVGDFFSFTAETFNECIDRGPKAYFLASQAVGRQMVSQGAGKIINLITSDARVASAESTGASAAHSSIDAMTRAIAQALGYYGVNVNALVCGPTEDFSGTPDEAGERLRRIPLGRLARPEDFTGAALFLASDDADFVAGESLYVDAGYSNAAVTEDGFRPAWARVWGKFPVPDRKN
jgi:NAD(P)-dependent dehydrogenase (short-subunit alcohol dehydrogenase family)